MVFDVDDLRMAVAGFLTIRGKARSASDIGRVDMVLLDKAVHCDVHDAIIGVSATRLQSDELLDAILMFCSDRRIPLPKRAVKKLELAGENLVLMMITQLSDRKAASVWGQLHHPTPPSGPARRDRA